MNASDLSKIAERLPLSEATRRRNAEKYGGAYAKEFCKPDPSSKPDKRIRQDRPLNKLEHEWLELMKRSGVDNLRSQSLRFRLASGLYYTPDNTGTVSGQPTAWEVKGPRAWDDAIAKLKVAASVYPDWRWVLVWKDNGMWREQLVIP